MCGIAGVIHDDRARPVPRETLVAMAAILRHRGPDGYGCSIGEGVGFGHSRLSIVDLHPGRGRQPFTHRDGRFMLSKNGELYDYQRLRASLAARGARFRTKSDSELILHLYPRLGFAGMLPYLRGEFAFALYDRDEDTLFLARDRFGIKPLYWARTRQGLVFGSELKALFAHPEVAREFAPEGLYHQLMQTMVPGTTAFAGIRQVEPGHYLEVRRRDGRLAVRNHRYWDLAFPVVQGPLEVGDEQPYIDEVRRRLVDAVHLRLEADVPVGCYLSGGIDSCSIMGLAAAARQEPVKAFTIGFDTDEYDETAIAREMAEATGAEQEVLRVDSDHLYDHFEETLWHTERSIYNTLGVAKLLMSRRVRELDYKVVLTGEGSDELFAGYPALRRDFILHGLHGLPANERAEWASLLASRNERFRGAMLAEDAVHDPAFEALLGFTPSCLQPWLAAGRRVPGLLHRDLRCALSGYEPGRAIAEALDADALSGRNPLDQAQYVWIKTMLEGQILTWGGDRVDMANSMEARPAFLDHHLAEYAATVPPPLRIKGRTEKYVLREAMRGLLPRRLYEREKVAFMAPPAHADAAKWAAMQRLASEYLGDAAVRAAGLLDPGGVRDVFALHAAPGTTPATRTQLDAMVNHLLSVQILHKHFVATDVPREARERARAIGWC
jgi:asparagine synthase (glutamine-hydrolysing)